MKKTVLLFIFLLLFILPGCDSNSAVTEDNVNKFTVLFNSDGGSNVEKQLVEKGSNVARPQDPIKEGYSFDGWYVGDEKWSFINNTVTVNLELTAHWKINEYTLIIKYNDEVTSDLVITQNYGTVVDTIQEPTRLGYTFAEWSEEIPNIMPAENLTIEANWTINQYLITIKYNDSHTPDLKIKQDYNSDVISIENPERLGYTFDKWSVDIPNKMPPNDLVIEAQWKINTYTLTVKNYDYLPEYDSWYDKDFYFDYGSDLIIEMHSVVGFTFDEYIGEIPEIMPAENLTIEAKWTINKYSITIKYNDGITNDLVITQNYNTNIDRIDSMEDLQRCGYTFGYWSVSLPLKMPSVDLIIEAIWIPDVEYINTNDGIIITGLYNEKKDLVILDEYDNKKVVGIQANAFLNCTSLTSITIPDSVVKIGEDAFKDCVFLSKVNISNIEKWMNIDFGNSASNPLYFAHNLYLNGILVEELSIPEGITNIRDYTFCWCESIKGITISNSVISIGDYAFCGCTNVRSVKIGNSVSKIGYYAFSGAAITSITIPASIEIIASGAFMSCTRLLEVINKSNLSLTIGSFDYGYVACYARQIISDERYSKVTLTSDGLYLYDDGNDIYVVNYMGDNTDIVIPSNVTKIADHAFYLCQTLTSVIIPSNVKSIGDEGFAFCKSLNNIILSEGLTSIGMCAFANCEKLESIIIPMSVTSMGDNPFTGCKQLTIYCKTGGPANWPYYWNSGRPVEWNYKG